MSDGIKALKAHLRNSHRAAPGAYFTSGQNLLYGEILRDVARKVKSESHVEKAEENSRICMC